MHLQTMYLVMEEVLTIQKIKRVYKLHGLTKSLGEDLILQEHKRSMIIRFSSVFSEYGNNFVKKL